MHFNRKPFSTTAFGRNLPLVLFILAVAGLGLPHSARAEASVRVENLRCEYRVAPMGLDIAKPRLSWTLASKGRNVRQSAYQIIVASSRGLLTVGGGDLWDSGKVPSDQMSQVPYEGRYLYSRQICYWKVRVWDQNGRSSSWSDSSSWKMGLLEARDWQAQWIGSEEGRVDGPTDTAESQKKPLATPRYLRKEFQVTKPVARAMVYATALGLYELRLNGQRVGEHLLAPEWTRYTHRVQLDCLDVTELVKRGDNALGAILGNGWYSGMFMCWPQRGRIYGDRPWFGAQLEIEYRDGERQIITTDGSWRETTRGPIRQSGIYEGEMMDARLEMPGWDQPHFDDAAWRAAAVGKDVRAGKFVWQRSEPISVTQTLRPIALTEPKPGVYLFDLGQNMAGWCRFTAQAPSGTEVVLRHGEVLNPDGSLYTANLRGALATDRYIFGGTGKPETFEPHFTYHGFRYVEVSGLPSKPGMDAIQGMVFHTRFQPAGEFECSDPLLNRLAKNISWSMRANYMGIPTDCPNRDERTGCAGDHQFFMPTAIYNADVAAFFSKWLFDLCEDAQSDNGAFADVAPYYGMWPGLSDGWGDAGILCPYQAYRAYGDTQILADHYAAMRRFHAFLKSTSTNDLRHLVGPGDWLNQGGTAKPEVIATAYYAHETDIMAEVAGVLGHDKEAEEYRNLATRIKQAFAKAYIHEDGSIEQSSQTAYAMAFSMHLVPDALRSKMSDQFAHEIERFQYHPTVGFIGIAHLLPGLQNAGRDDLACRLLLQKTYPSWLYMVEHGATTIWERWDSYTPEKGFQEPGMNSFNHVVWGCSGEYIFSGIGGIQASSPGFRTVVIRPVLAESLTWAKCRYNSIRGPISTSWKKEKDGLTLEVTIPANTSATVFVPTSGIVQESRKLVEASRGAQLLRREGDDAVYQVGSGHYEFRSH